MFGVRCSMFDVLPLLLFACLGGGFAACLSASEPSFLQDTNEAPVPVLIASATPVKPAARRAFAEADLLELLTQTLQDDYVKDKGELELRLARPWASRDFPDEPLTIKVLDLPRTGVNASFIIRFELRTARELLGTWQISLQARVWRDIWIARAALKRGEILADAGIERERRDVLTLHEPLAEFAAGDMSLEMAEPLQAGSPLLSRSVKLRPVIRRGQSADALIRDGSLSISMKVEALEDGAPGQIIRARNAQTRRDIRGKVLNEQTILVSL
jgi:flagellar basal body P-ring formation protein FlgA